VALEKDRAGAEAIDARLQRLHTDLFVEPNPIPVKWALQQMGRMPGGVRLPLVPLDANHHARVRSALEAAGVLT
jgi:4-hydroxy-tetrahydrodipicolinate synthase